MKHVKLEEDTNVLLNKTKALMLTLNPVEKITDNIIIKKVLKYYLEVKK